MNKINNSFTKFMKRRKEAWLRKCIKKFGMGF